MAVELLEQVPGLDAILVPVSGGGMLAGICVAAKAIKPNIKSRLIIIIIPTPFFKKSEVDIVIASVRRYAISSLTIGRNPTKFGMLVAHMNGACSSKTNWS